MVLFLALLGAAGTLVHNHEDLAGSNVDLLADGVPLAVYLGLALAGFLPRLRPAASWMLLLSAWVMVIMALAGLIPQTVMVDGFDGFSGHLIVHAIVLAAQVPLIVILIRRLNGTACRWTAPAPNRR